ncbi:NYN domain-containing protein [Stenotrophomonas sp. PA-6-5C]|uniref:NYN domain-containing protein n=1 Tax=Stenotrophomonas sp. PA-6-5C TaxID=2665487 RepID=UPI001F37549C|nr:NYN domain-containing protein [Stenotrophomonas sp. PA-6-5C]
MAQPQDSTVAVMIDCDNVAPEIVDFALLMAAQAGRVTLRRGYGNRTTLGNSWQEALVRQAFTPCLQFQYAAKKNTSDIALALDALEALFDQRADIFCLVTSDSDFAYLCRKLRERGATVLIVGEAKTPDALRNACDQFFEWSAQEASSPEPSDLQDPPHPADHSNEAKTTGSAPLPKRRPRFVIEAVSLLAGSTPEGKVSLNSLGSYLKRADSGFSPGIYGHSGLLNMVKTYDLLSLKQEENGQWSVSLAPKPETA